MRRTLLGLLVVFILFPINGPGESYGLEKQVSLTEAVKTALKENHEIRAAQNQLFAQKDEVGIARSAIMPRIAVEERATRTNNAPTSFMLKLNQGRFSQSDFDINSLNNPDPVNDFQTLLSIEQPIFDLKSSIGLSMAKRSYAAQGKSFQRKKEETALKVARVYLQVHTAKGVVEVTQKALEDAREHLRIVEERYKNGLGLYSDTLRATTAVTAAEQQVVSADKNLAVAKRMLGLLMGTADSVDIDNQNIDLPFKPMEYYAGASLSRKDLEALAIHHENAQTNVKLAESRYFPTLRLAGSYQLNDHRAPLGSEGESWLAMAALHWDLFDGTNREFARSKALHQVKEVEEQLKGLKKVVSFKIQEAFLNVEEAKKNAQLARSALKTAEEGKRLVKSRYENSLSLLVDFLDVQVHLDQARVNKVARENEYLFAVINLCFESGTILTDLKAE